MIVQDDRNTVEANFLDLFAYILVIKSNRFPQFLKFYSPQAFFWTFSLLFFHFMSKFLFLFVILRSVQSFFWTFFFFLLNISPIFYCFSIIRVDLITKFGHITFTYALYVQSPVSSICMAELLRFLHMWIFLDNYIFKGQNILNL